MSPYRNLDEKYHLQIIESYTHTNNPISCLCGIGNYVCGKLEDAISVLQSLYEIRLHWILSTLSVHYT